MIKKVFLFSGDSFLTDERYKHVIAESEKKFGQNISRQTFYLKDTTLQEILIQARTLPFMTDAQIFRIRECERLKKDDVETLTSFFSAQPEHTVLIFESDSITAKSPIYDAVAKFGEASVLGKDRGHSSASRYIEDKLKQFGKTMTSIARKRVEAEVGDSPSFLDSILNQLILYSGDKPEITNEMIDLFEENWSTADTFAFIDSVVSGNAAKSLALFHDLIDKGDGDLIQLLGLINWQLKRFWQTAVLIEEGESDNAIMKKCRIYPNQARMFFQQVRRMKRAAIEAAIERLFQLDWAIKTGQTADLYGMERWIVELSAAEK